MKKMPSIIVLIIVLAGLGLYFYQSNKPTFITIIGVAQNVKHGAELLSDERGAVLIEGLNAWPSEIVGTSVKVTGKKLVYQETVPASTIDENGAISQGSETAYKQWVLIEAKWNTQNSPGERTTSLTEPESFQFASLNNYDRTECSPPEPESSWRGVSIRAPQRVTFNTGDRVGAQGTFASIPICGLYVLNVPYPVITDEIRLHAVDMSSRSVYSGTIIDLDPSLAVPPPQEPPVRKEDVEGMAVGRYFNVNLIDHVDLPERSGTWEVFAEVQGNRSNVVIVEVIESR